MKNKLTMDDKVLFATMWILLIIVAVEFGGMLYYKTKWKETEKQLVKIQSEK